MWPNSFSLTWFTIAARVVDLPEPVGPVTRIRPRGRSVRSAKTFGAFRSSSDSTFDGIVRNAAAAPRCWLYALTRKRARFGTAKLKSHSRNSSYILRCASLMMSYTMACTSSCSIGGRLMRRMSPCTRISGGSPDDRWRSEALFLTANARSSVISMGSVPDRDAADRTAADGLDGRPHEWAGHGQCDVCVRKRALRLLARIFDGFHRSRCLAR